MFVVLYSWKIKPELEQQFIEAWSQVTKYYLETFDSLGSRLHKGDDDIWYAYAQWKSAEQRENAFANNEIKVWGEKMTEAIEKRFPEKEFAVVADLFK